MAFFGILHVVGISHLEHKKSRIPGIKKDIGIFHSGFSLRDFQSPLLIPGIRDRDFLFRARSKNPEKPEILGIGIGIWKSQKIPVIPGFFVFGITRRFFPWDGISRLKATSVQNDLLEQGVSWELTKNLYHEITQPDRSRQAQQHIKNSERHVFRKKVMALRKIAKT